ncbi:MAG: uracil-DNA glycosylase [Rhodobacterales bacterium]|nr:uracil-DNA glycosylase [Rhodobacterales bacterium]
MILPDPPAAWAASGAFAGPEWPALRARLAAETRPCAPAPDAVFRALALTPPDRVRVVILGQDPYATPGRATGLAFSFPPGQEPRDSLRNILAELTADTGIRRAGGDLAGWAAQGVLLLNTVLTVPLGQPGGHRRLGWQAITARLLAPLAARPVAFLLWGRDAAALADPVLAAAGRGDDGVIRASHPSSLGARRPLGAHPPFVGHRPFGRANAWLTARGVAPVDWAA